ncbi:alpha/beta-hydrolase [Bimuria novae-zelandiae CBS 107.79]|uniref:Alpha/beta-hydrolase n=1 Tax=Bimuria novae-zelandiae CBS 107.79 TaxID=1447943 RepID=A0A6A5UYF4_9PLEO|nr:alpha/beta-hydrolase [Bimuria novae-zelandiae CBS 107.79]
MSSFYTAESGAKLHYKQTGAESGPLIVCLHGLGGSTETYTPLLPLLPSKYRIILLDFPGFGQSSLPTTEKSLSINGHVSDVDEFIAHVQGSSDDAGKTKIILFGHSLGTAVAMHYAAKRPENVAGLVLFTSIQSAAHIPAARERMLGLAAGTRKHGIAFAAEMAAKSNFPADELRPINPNLRQAVAKAVALSDSEGYAQTCEAVVGLDHKDPDYSRITAPTMLVAGDLDTLSPIAKSQTLSELIAGKSWVEVVKSGHQPILEDTSAVAAAVNKLLQSIDSSG